MKKPGRMIDYLRISITDRCNFRCTYCMPPSGITHMDRDELMDINHIAKFTEAAVEAGVTRVRITGGEPLVQSDCATLVERLAGIRGIRDLSLTTNGSLLERHAIDLRTAGLSRINISIDSLNEKRFARITRGGSLSSVMAGLESALEAGFSPLKVNAVALEGIEDDLEDFVRLTRERPVHVRFIEFMPIGRRIGVIGWKFVSRERLLDLLGEFGRLGPADSPDGAGPARYFQYEGAPGTIGFISSMSDHFCKQCNRLRLTADGRLRNCLFSGDEVDVRPLIEDNAPGRAALTRAILDSMNSKKFSRADVSPGMRTMAQIGG